MGVDDAPNEEPMRIAAPAGAAALVAIAGVVTMSLANNPSTEQATASAGYAQPQQPPGSGVPGIAQNQAQGRGAPEMGVEIVVKFKDDGMVKDITDLFWRDQGAAQTRFSSFKRRWDVLAPVRLARVTYSNELVLVAAGNTSADEMRQIARDIGQLPEVSYAEPNSTAQPGER